MITSLKERIRCHVEGAYAMRLYENEATGSDSPNGAPSARASQYSTQLALRGRVFALAPARTSACAMLSKGEICR
jgi:hypothetical protein